MTSRIDQVESEAAKYEWEILHSAKETILSFQHESDYTIFRCRSTWVLRDPKRTALARYHRSRPLVKSDEIESLFELANRRIALEALKKL